MGFDGQQYPPNADMQPPAPGAPPSQPLPPPYPQTWTPGLPVTYPPMQTMGPPPIRPSLWRNPVFIALAVGLSMLLILGLAGGGFLVLRGLLNHTDGYLYSDDSSVGFIQWTEDSSHHLVGTLQIAEADSNNNLQSQSYPFNGIRNNDRLSISFTLGGTVDGSLQGNTLTLAIPTQDGTLSQTVFHAASVQQYNDAVTALKTRLAHITGTEAAVSATTTTQASLDQAVSSANDTLGSALSTLAQDKQTLASDTAFKSILDDYANDWATMQKDYKQEQIDAAGGCANASDVAYDVSSVNYDLSSITYDDSSLAYQANLVTNDLAAVNKDISTVQSDWQSLQNAVQNDNGRLSARYSQSDIDGAVSAAQAQVTSSNKALTNAQATAKGYDNKATSKASDAQKLSDNMHC